MTPQSTVRTLALSLLLVSGASQAGLFSKKKPPPPPPPEPAPVVVPVAPPPPPPPPPPIPLEFSGIQTAAPIPTSLDRLQSASPEVLDTVQWVAASKDNAGLPFIVVDKVNARPMPSPGCQLKATAPVLLAWASETRRWCPGRADVGDAAPEAHHARRSLPSKLVIDIHGKWSC